GQRASDFKALAARGGLEYVHEGGPRARFDKALSTIERALGSGKNLDQTVAALTTRDSRREVFHLEALLRLYSHREDDGLLPALKAEKKLEDAIGAVSPLEHVLKDARTKRAPQAVV